MPPELQRITDEILALPTSSRALLARLLLDSLEPGSIGQTAEIADLERSWAEEANRRVRQIDEGEIQLLDGDDVMREMRALCR